MDGHTKPLVLASDNGSKVRFAAQQHMGPCAKCAWSHVFTQISAFFTISTPWPSSVPLVVATATIFGFEVVTASNNSFHSPPVHEGSVDVDDIEEGP